MEKSQFSQYIKKFFAGIALLLTKTINGKEAELTYLYKLMLTKKFSANMEWTTLNIDGRAVMADVVALDARLPLKKRSKIERAKGSIPKLGTKRSLNETQMNEIMLLEAMPGDNSKEISQIIFDDTVQCTKGVWERLEYQFLQALSNNGVFEVDDENNVGIQYRVDLGQPDKNKFGAVIVWSDPNARPIDDISRIKQAAKRYGHSLRIIHMDLSTFTALLNNAQVKQLVAGFGGNFATTGWPTPTSERFLAYMQSEYQMTFNIIDRSVVFERDGADTVFNCWTDNKVVFTSTMNVGSLVYGKLAAELRPNKSADYAKVDDYILLTKWQADDDTPLEFTTSTARVMPVINMFNIYSLDTEEAQPTTGQTEGDATITIYGDNTIVKATVIQVLNDLGVKVNTNITDVKLIEKVNELSDKNEAALKAALGVD